MRVHKSIAFTVCFALALATVLVMAVFVAGAHTNAGSDGSTDTDAYTLA